MGNSDPREFARVAPFFGRLHAVPISYNSLLNSSTHSVSSPLQIGFCGEVSDA